MLSAVVARPSRIIVGCQAVLLTAWLTACGTLETIDPEEANLIIQVVPSTATVTVTGEGEIREVAVAELTLEAVVGKELRYLVTPGQYLVTVEADGYDTVTHEYRVAAGATVTPWKVELKRNGAEPPDGGAGPGDGGGEQPVPPGDGVRVAFGLRGDPGFEAAQLSGEERLWYERVWAAIENPDAFEDMDQLAASDELYHYARSVHRHVQSLLLAFRATGDLRLLDEIDRLLWIMRGELRDEWRGTMDGTDGTKDGYLNWVYRGTGGNSESIWGKDLHKMEEILTHSMVASVAYALEVNRDLESPGGRNYAAHADFWRDYLINHFEAKWRERQKKPEGLPYLQKDLLHAYVSGIKLHYYLYRLTGDVEYLREAERQADMVWGHEMHLVDTPAGQAYVWSHGVMSEGDGPHCLQATTYARYVFADAVEFHLEGFDRWADAEEMERLGRTFSQFILDRENADGKDWFASDVGGDEGSLAGIPDNLGASRMSTGKFAQSTYALAAAWDTSGELTSVSDEVLRLTGDPDAPRSVHLAVGLFLDAAVE